MQFGRIILHLVLGSFLLMVALVVYHVKFQPKPPMEQMASTRSLLLEAKENGAQLYRKSELEKAKRYYDTAMNSLKIENQQFIFARDYSLSTYYANQANFWAQASVLDLKKLHHQHLDIVGERAAAVGKKIQFFNDHLARLPMNPQDAQALADVKMHYKEANVAYANQHLLASEKKLLTVEKQINRLTEVYSNRLQTYFVDYPLWSKISQAAVESSRVNKNELLLVDKCARRCFFYQKGELVSTFDMELGANWMGDKQQAGDKTTPEGNYKVMKKKAGAETRYYKALLINYPNEDDKIRFDKNKSNGQLGSSPSIGSLIEVHGDGGKGYDWTDGCIALKNDDMDRLFAVSKEGMPVVIVGSLVPLDRIIK